MYTFDKIFITSNLSRKIINFNCNKILEIWYLRLCFFLDSSMQCSLSWQHGHPKLFYSFQAISEDQSESHPCLEVGKGVGYGEHLRYSKSIINTS